MLNATKGHYSVNNISGVIVTLNATKGHYSVNNISGVIVTVLCISSNKIFKYMYLNICTKLH